MTKDQITKEISRAAERYDALTAAWGPLIAAVGNHDFPAWVESWETFSAYLELVAIRIGDPMLGTQHGSWLSWFIYDNLCGRRGHEAKAGAWKKARPIRTAADLAALIVADSK